MAAPIPRPGFHADPAECLAFLAAHPHINFFDLLFTGLSGVPRGKRLRRQELEAVYRQGRFLPLSVAVIDINGQDCEATGLIWEAGDADSIARPIPGRLTPAPWLGEDMGQVACSLHGADGAPEDIDPRAILARVIDRFTADGMTPVVACELEFYLVDERRARDGSLRLPRGQGSLSAQAYGLPEIEDAAPFLRDLWAACDAQAIPLEGVIAEAAPGQYELTLSHKADALAAADDAMLYKRTAKGCARNHGLAATFMAKPWADRVGSGMHLHVSVVDGDGRNLMASDDPAGSPLTRHAIGGMAALLAESMAIFAPNQNSYRRFAANSYAPVNPNWGINNRTVALRIPAGAPPTRHIEHRVAGADANPHLALAAMLAGVHHGIANAIDPGDPVAGDGYAATQAAGAPLPTNWFDSLRLFEGSTILAGYLGARATRMYAAMKRTEQARYFEAVTPRDYDWYLANA